MDFRELLASAKSGQSQATEKLITMYRPLLMKAAIINGTFDEDLFQELSIVFLRCIQNFKM